MARQEINVSSNTIKLGRKGDAFTGAFVSLEQAMNANKYNGEKDYIVTLKGVSGEFHETSKDESTGQIVVATEATPVAAGETYSMFISPKKVILLRQLKALRAGDVATLEHAGFAESKTPGMNPAKIVKVYREIDDSGKQIVDESVLPEVHEDMMSDDKAL